MIATIVAEVAAQSDPLLEAVKTSGPAGGLVILLGVLIRSWLASLIANFASLQAAVARLEATASTSAERHAEVRVQVGELLRRVDVLERRGGA